MYFTYKITSSNGLFSISVYEITETTKNEKQVVHGIKTKDIAESDAQALVAYFTHENHLIQEQIRLNRYKNELLIYGDVVNISDWESDGKVMRIYTIDVDDTRKSILMCNGDVISISP